MRLPVQGKNLAYGFNFKEEIRAGIMDLRAKVLRYTYKME